MGVGPMVSIPKVLKLTGLALSDIDLIVFNEAFASQALAVIREVGLDLEKTNVNGGAIALGHPAVHKTDGYTCLRVMLRGLRERV
jgi:acetyl-CoA acyltransferase